MEVRRAKASDAEAVIALMAGLGRPPVAGGDEVDPAFRRRGAARALLDACVAAARDRGCHRLVLESGRERAEAQLYESYGFTFGGRAYGLSLI